MINSITTSATERSSLSTSNRSASLTSSNKMELSLSQVTKIPDSEDSNKNHNRSDDKNCPICLEEFKVGDEVSWSRNLTHCR